jgi:hypothetical protein
MGGLTDELEAAGDGELRLRGVRGERGETGEEEKGLVLVGFRMDIAKGLGEPRGEWDGEESGALGEVEAVNEVVNGVAELGGVISIS